MTWKMPPGIFFAWRAPNRRPRPNGRCCRSVPMREIYEMFRGKFTPEQVMRATGDGADAQFYAYLYTGLYYEALGDAQHALHQITEAADDRFSFAGYMHGGARVPRD